MNNEKHGRGQGGQAEALTMLEVFASVGVQFFDITHTNIEGEKRGFRPEQSLATTCTSMPHLVASAPRRQNNVIVRPHHPRPVILIQLDDLDAAALDRVRPVSFLILQTSPGNHQAWVAVEGQEGTTDADFARRLRKGAGADPTASGATRVAGTANFKRKYEPDFPTVEIAAAQPGLIVTGAKLEALGLVTAPEPVKTLPANQNRRQRQAAGPAINSALTVHLKPTAGNIPTPPELILHGASRPLIGAGTWKTLRPA